MKCEAGWGTLGPQKQAISLYHGPIQCIMHFLCLLQPTLFTASQSKFQYNEWIGDKTLGHMVLYNNSTTHLMLARRLDNIVHKCMIKTPMTTHHVVIVYGLCVMTMRVPAPRTSHLMIFLHDQLMRHNPSTCVGGESVQESVRKLIV